MSTTFTDVDTVYNTIRTSLPGVVDDLITQELGAVLLDFFDNTSAWTELISVPTVTDQTDYVIASKDGEIIRVIATYNDAGIEISAAFSMPYTLVLHNKPNGGLTFTTRVALRPTGQAPLRIPNWVWGKYRLGLEYGVKGRLMAQPSKPYTNTQLAVLNTRQYNVARAQARVEAATMYKYGGQNWQFPQDFRTRRRR